MKKSSGRRKSPKGSRQNPLKRSEMSEREWRMRNANPLGHNAPVDGDGLCTCIGCNYV